MDDLQNFLSLSKDFKRHVIYTDPIPVKDANQNLHENIVHRDNTAEYSQKFVEDEEEQLYQVSKCSIQRNRNY